MNVYLLWLKENWKAAGLGVAAFGGFCLIMYFGRQLDAPHQEKIRAEVGEESEFEKTMNHDTRMGYMDMIHQANVVLRDGHQFLRPVDAMLMRAYAKTLLGRYDSALNDYSLAKELSPDYGKNSYCTEIAWTLARRERTETAVRIWEELVHDFPKELGAAGSYGIFLSRTRHDHLRDPARAVRLLRKSLMERKVFSSDKRSLSEALAANGEFDLAAAESADATVLCRQEHAERKRRMEKDITESRKHGPKARIEYLENQVRVMEDHHQNELQKLESHKKIFRERKPLPPSTDF